MLALQASEHSKKLKKLFQEHNITFLKEEDVAFLTALERNSKEMSVSLKKAAASVKKKVKDI